MAYLSIKVGKFPYRFNWWEALKCRVLTHMKLQEQISDLKSALKREKAARKTAEEQLEQRSGDLLRSKEELQQANKQIKELSGARPSDINRTHELELNSLKEQHEKLNILFKNSPAGLFMANPMGDGLVFSNDAVSKILGLTTEQLKTENVAANVHPFDKPSLLKAQNAMYSGEKDGFSIKTRMFNKEGKIVWIKLSLNAVRDASGKVICEVGFAEDITNEKNLEGLLKEQQDKLEILLNHSHFGIILSNNRGQGAILANAKACEILGYTEEELKSATVRNIVYVGDFTKLQKASDELHSGQKSQFALKIRLFTKKKKIVWTKFSVVGVRDASGKVMYEAVTFEDITKERELNNLLKEQQDKLEILLNNSHVGILLSKNKVAILANATACKILGYTEDELRSEVVGNVIHADDIPRLEKELIAMYDGEKDTFTLEMRLVAKAGGIIWSKTNIAAVRYASGKVNYEVVTFEDITKEKELSDKVKLSEILLTNLVAAAPIGVLIINEFGKVTLANKKLCDIFHLDATPEQLVGYAGSTLAEKCKSSARDPEQFIQKVKQLHARKSFIFKEEIEFADGRVFERLCMPLSYQTKDKGFLVSYTNITAIKEYEDKLQMQEETYATVIENMNLGWTETDREGHILRVNKSFCELSEYAPEELIGKQGTEFLLVDNTRERMEYYNNTEQKVYPSHDLQVITKSGKIKHVLVSGHRTRDSKGELVGSVGIIFDITKQKELELQKAALLKELASQNEQLNDYAHIVSHDLKSPLRSISALLSWTKEDFSEKLGEAGLKNLDLIEERVEKMDLLIENILRYSSLDNGELKDKNIDLNSVVQDIVEMLVISKNIQINIVRKLPVILANETRMQQLFQNLISNAVNHVDKNKGKIEIDYSDTDTHYQFAIKDNGRGIKKEYHDKIFKVFKSFDDRDMSTGIGLSIVKKVVDGYKGEIWLESEVGKGTTFFFTLKKQA